MKPEPDFCEGAFSSANAVPPRILLLIHADENVNLYVRSANI